MQRTAPFKVGVTALFAFFLGVAPALAAGKYPPCETFVLQGGLIEIKDVDAGPKGKGLGDERITKEELFDADGNFAGVARLIHVIVEPVEGSVENITLGVNAFSLPEGTLYGQVLMDYTSDFYKDHLPKHTAMIAVVGGTGAYVKSKGQIVVSFPQKSLSPVRAEFQLYCQ
jgi:hypothetical protein